MSKREFYRVLPEYDGKKYKCTRYNHVYYEPVIADELITPYMVKKHNIPMKWLSHEYIDKDKWYWFFGARFSFPQTFNEDISK